MPYALGIPVLDQLSLDEQAASSPGGDNGIDWTQVITTGEQVIGQVINHGTPIPTRYPVYTAGSTALSSAVPLLAVAGIAFLLMRRR